MCDTFVWNNKHIYDYKMLAIYEYAYLLLERVMTTNGYFQYNNGCGQRRCFDVNNDDDYAKPKMEEYEIYKNEMNKKRQFISIFNNHLF